MRRTGILSAAVGLLVAAAVAAAELRDGGEKRAPAGRASVAAAPKGVDREPAETVVVRRRGGVPRSWSRRLANVNGVAAVSRVGRSHVLLVRTRDSGGLTVDAAPAGHAFPLDALVVSPRSYAGVVPAPARRAFRKLVPGTRTLVADLGTAQAGRGRRAADARRPAFAPCGRRPGR